MNLAALIQNQTLATLLQALQPAGELVPGRTVEATLLSVDGEGVATAQVGDARIALVLAGPQARQTALQPGATLVIRLEPATEPGAPLRATLVEARPAPAGPTSPAQPLPQAGSPAPTPQPVATGQGQPPYDQAIPVQVRSPSAPATPVAVTTPAPQASATIDPAVTAAPSPRAAAGPLLGPALARQNSLAPLFANLRSVAQGSVALVLPKPLLPLIEHILAQAVPVERRPVGAEQLRQAVQASGLFLEAREDAGQAPPSRIDLKASLTALRDALAPVVEKLTPDLVGRPAAAKPEAAKAEPGAPRPVDDQTAAPRTPPPRRDGTLTPQPIAEPSLHPAETPLVVVETLLDQTDAALDRITLSQYASLPLDAGRVDPSQGPRWLTEVPFAFQQGTAMVPLRIEQEPPRRGPAGVEPALWRLRFALDVEPIGPLQGVVTLQGRSVGVTLWAEREETSRMLRSATPGLEAALLQADFENGTVNVHTGQPRVMQPTAGQFLDRLS